MLYPFPPGILKIQSTSGFYNIEITMNTLGTTSGAMEKPNAVHYAMETSTVFVIDTVDLNLASMIHTHTIYFKLDSSRSSSWSHDSSIKLSILVRRRIDIPHCSCPINSLCFPTFQIASTL